MYGQKAQLQPRGLVYTAARSVFSLEGWYVWPYGQFSAWRPGMYCRRVGFQPGRLCTYGRKGQPQPGGIVYKAAEVSSRLTGCA